jgi:hypothetical protein
MPAKKTEHKECWFAHSTPDGEILCMEAARELVKAAADLAEHFAANPTHLSKKAGE